VIVILSRNDLEFTPCVWLWRDGSFWEVINLVEKIIECSWSFDSRDISCCIAEDIHFCIPQLLVDAVMTHSEWLNGWRWRIHFSGKSPFEISFVDPLVAVTVFNDGYVVEVVLSRNDLEFTPCVWLWWDVCREFFNLVEKLIACSWSFDSRDSSCRIADDFNWLIVSRLVDTVFSNFEWFNGWSIFRVNSVALSTLNLIDFCSNFSYNSSQDLPFSISITRSDEPFGINVSLLIELPFRSNNRILSLISIVIKPVSGDIVVWFVDPFDGGWWFVSRWSGLFEDAIIYCFAELEVLCDGVGEFKEFLLINFTWGSGVDFASSFFDPAPFFLGDGVVLRPSEILNSNFDFIIGEGLVVIGVKRSELILGELSGDAW